MDRTLWILLDTETTGIKAPVYVVELAAQRMRGWEPDGEPPLDVYGAFAAYLSAFGYT